MLKHARSIRPLVLLAAISLAGCLGYRTPMLDPNQSNPTSPPLARDASADLASARTCPAEKNYVLVLGNDGQLYRFDASTLALTSLATVDCGDEGLNSLTVSPIGPLTFPAKRATCAQSTCGRSRPRARHSIP